MADKIFKRPSYRQRKFGVNSDGRDGLSLFFNEWGKGFGRMMDIRERPDVGDRAGIWATLSVAVGLSAYGIGQIVEYESDMNARPPLPEAHMIDFDERTASFVTIYPDIDYTSENINTVNSNAKEYFVLQDPENGTYEINTCHSTCRALSADEVRELRGELRVMAAEEEVDYLDPRFIFPHKITFISEPLRVQEINENLFAADDDFYEAGEPRRYFRTAPYEVDSEDQRLNSEFVDFDQEGITALWRAALDAPDNGTYQVQGIDSDASQYVWPRVEGEEWQDTIVSTNAAATIGTIFMLLTSMTALGQISPAIRRTKEKTKPLEGFRMLRHKPQ